MKKVLAVIFSLFFFAALAPSPAPAAPASAAADFYKGKTIKILVGFSPGNNTDVTGQDHCTLSGKTNQCHGGCLQ